MKHWIAKFARRLFQFRLLFGIVISVLALEWLSPTPFFDARYRMIHGIALLIIAAGLALRGWGSGVAGHHTRSTQIEAPTLVTAGPFAHVRNPIYAGSILIGVGMATLIGDLRAFLFAGAAFAILYLAIIPAEEDFLQRQFGEEYRRYKQAVPRLLPRLTPWNGRVERAFNWKAVIGELEILSLLVLIYGALLLEELFD
ncbi:unnamed protein product [uncultured bacterium]|nr:unnamed protein product [uncultured bacterium]